MIPTGFHFIFSVCPVTSNILSLESKLRHLSLPFSLTLKPKATERDFKFRLDTIEEDSKEILKKIEIKNQMLPFSHITNGQSSDKTAKQYYSELGKVSN